MRVAIAVAVLAGSVVSSAQPGAADGVEASLRQLFPQAASFSGKVGNPPHYEAYAVGPAAAGGLMGVAVWTTDLDPLERGYDGPIKILVGITSTATIAGIVVADHHEPYGYFSVDRPEFAAQFSGKNLRDPFKVGGDVDAVSRATLTVTSASRAIRNSARRAATALLRPKGR